MKEPISEKEYILGNHSGCCWGTKYDDLKVKQVPPKYAGKSFIQMNHSDLNSFLLADNISKFEMAFWAERYQSAKAFKYGFMIGIVLMVLLIVSFI
jgi:hypothetical protein